MHTCGPHCKCKLCVHKPAVKCKPGCGSHGLQTHVCLPQGCLLHACMRLRVYQYPFIQLYCWNVKVQPQLKHRSATYEHTEPDAGHLAGGGLPHALEISTATAFTVF